MACLCQNGRGCRKEGWREGPPTAVQLYKAPFIAAEPVLQRQQLQLRVRLQGSLQGRGHTSASTMTAHAQLGGMLSPAQHRGRLRKAHEAVSLPAMIACYTLHESFNLIKWWHGDSPFRSSPGCPSAPVSGGRGQHRQGPTAPLLATHGSLAAESHTCCHGAAFLYLLSSVAELHARICWQAGIGSCVQAKDLAQTAHVCKWKQLFPTSAVVLE